MRLFLLSIVYRAALYGCAPYIFPFPFLFLFRGLRLMAAPRLVDAPFGYAPKKIRFVLLPEFVVKEKSVRLFVLSIFYRAALHGCAPYIFPFPFLFLFRGLRLMAAPQKRYLFSALLIFGNRQFPSVRSIFPLFFKVPCATCLHMKISVFFFTIFYFRYVNTEGFPSTSKW